METENQPTKSESQIAKTVETVLHLMQIDIEALLLLFKYRL